MQRSCIGCGRLSMQRSPAASPPWKWDMDIQEWLHGLGLQQYVTAFADNAIDAEVLPELTEADLEKLGVLLGYRKRLLKAIAALTAPATAVLAALVGPAPSPGDGAERRQLTWTTGLFRLSPSARGGRRRAVQLGLDLIAAVNGLHVPGCPHGSQRRLDYPSGASASVLSLADNFLTALQVD